MSTGTFQRFSLSPNSIICWLALSREHKITSRREKVSEKLESYPGGFEHAHHHAELSQSATHKLVANRNYFSRTLSSRLDFMSCADFFFHFLRKHQQKLTKLRSSESSASEQIYLFMFFVLRMIFHSLSLRNIMLLCLGNFPTHAYSRLHRLIPHHSDDF